MAQYLTTLRPVGVLGDQLDSTYEEGSAVSGTVLLPAANARWRAAAARHIIQQRCKARCHRDFPSRFLTRSIGILARSVQPEKINHVVLQFSFLKEFWPNQAMLMEYKLLFGIYAPFVAATESFVARRVARFIGLARTCRQEQGTFGYDINGGKPGSANHWDLLVDARMHSPGRIAGLCRSSLCQETCLC